MLDDLTPLRVSAADLMSWSDGVGKMPKCFELWGFTSGQLEQLSAYCQTEGVAEALAVGLNFFREEDEVMAFVEMAERASVF